MPAAAARRIGSARRSIGSGRSTIGDGDCATGDRGERQGRLRDRRDAATSCRPVGAGGSAPEPRGAVGRIAKSITRAPAAVATTIAAASRRPRDPSRRAATGVASRSQTAGVVAPERALEADRRHGVGPSWWIDPGHGGHDPGTRESADGCRKRPRARNRNPSGARAGSARVSVATDARGRYLPDAGRAHRNWRIATAPISSSRFI